MQQSIANPHRTSQFSIRSASVRSVPIPMRMRVFCHSRKNPPARKSRWGGWITLLRWLERQLQAKLHLPRGADGEDARAGSRTD